VPFTNQIVIFLNAAPAVSVPFKTSVKLAFVVFKGASVAFKIACVMFGAIFSTVKFVVSVLFKLPEVSLAKIVTLYTPIGSSERVEKVALKISPESKLRFTNSLVPSGKVIFAITLSPKFSVTFAVMFIFCVWLTMLGSAVTFLTSGIVISLTVKVVVSVLLMLPEVSFAVMRAV